MILISKNEAKVLRERCGLEAVKMSKSRYPKYYLVEDKRNLAELKRYRDSVTTKAN